jgi:hypothetical protein
VRASLIAASAVTLSVTAALIFAPTTTGCGGDDPVTPIGGVVTLPPAPEAGVVIDSRPVVCDEAELLPGDLRCTGLYADFDAKTIKPEAREFSPALSLFSDGAGKRRWLFLPPGTKIDTTNMDDWIFPAGTKVWKEFTVDGKLVETRLFVKKPTGGEWGFATYEWSADGKVALRLDSGKTNAVGTYEIPNDVHCSQCHNGHADRLLGVEAVLMGMPGAAGITLASLKAEGLLTAPPAVTTITLPGDERTQKALGYLHVNCGIACHSPVAAGTSNFTGLLLRLSARQLLAGPVLPAATDTFVTTIAKPFVSTQYLDDQRFVGFQRVIAKNPDKSLLLAVVQVNDTANMPPILRHKIDDAGVALLKDWISALP